jgi:hypothetical protein
MSTRSIISGLALATLAALAGCSDDHGISSDENARRACLGLDAMIGKAMDVTC